MTIPNKL